jgi:hypothetical protein
VFLVWLVGAVGKNRWDGVLVLLEEIFGPRGTLNVCLLYKVPSSVSAS